MDAMVQIAQRVLNRGCGGCRPERGAYATPSWLDALRERHICCWHKPTAGLLLFADVDSTLGAHFARMRQVPCEGSIASLQMESQARTPPSS